MREIAELNIQKMFCNYVTLRSHVRRDVCGSERIASRQGDLTNFHAAEPERLEIGTRVCLWSRFRCTRCVFAWGVHAPCFRKGPLSTSASWDYDLLRKRRSAKQTRAKNKILFQRLRRNCYRRLRWNVELRYGTSWPTCEARLISDKKPSQENSISENGTLGSIVLSMSTSVLEYPRFRSRCAAGRMLRAIPCRNYFFEERHESVSVNWEGIIVETKTLSKDTLNKKWQFLF